MMRQKVVEEPGNEAEQYSVGVQMDDLMIRYYLHHLNGSEQMENMSDLSNGALNIPNVGKNVLQSTANANTYYV